MSETEETLGTDPFLQLLTDALRAGPGSPEWNQAVARVNAGEKGPDDEYAMLVRARENLASGKAYRQVKPGVGFTRKVMQNVSNQAQTQQKTWFSASLISYIGAGLVVGVLAWLIFYLTQAGNPSGEDLTNLFFSTTKMSASLEAPLTADWKIFGPLKVDPTKGLAPTIPSSAKDYLGGGIVAGDGMSAGEPFAVEATFDFTRLGDDVVPQLFITEDPTFDSRGMSPNELLWQVQGGTAQVATGKGLTPASKKIADGNSIQVRIMVGKSDARVLCDNVELWSGSSNLGKSPRFVGVRFLCKNGGKHAVVVVKQLRVLTK